MKKVLLLSLLCLSFNSFAKDVQDMTKAEATIKHKELHAEVMKNADNSIELKSSCENFNEFAKSAGKHKKVDLLDMKAFDRFSEVSDVCDAKGYSLSY
ncbi:hypothetical protein GLP30_18920 [Photobacterium phosphoreum]|uniref:DUF3718 domain-containing protein n=1 Tax=Photobacterium phosphoreum TaxID=659 RepID=A0AAW5A0Y0_PHOPO|nr:MULTISPECIES: hypothetical protein [Photobacterium]MCD9465110.1 hypothetical protein [Photobacterium phosphoreum]MCD9472669.1 hypothetical protein [Photobacterium phosphoreum]MCD9477119.1 hypothetical protein [Photobacterium phosphoreum]MCD9481049.1 hypothetical protein [Photobacterium phosphoreum]MCD9485381.1 hypothetical protein [Photobacterium phosphoreum]